MLRPNIHLIGIQGSGKGTHAALLVESLGYTYLGSGNLLRERSHADDHLGHYLARNLEAGRLVADVVLYQVLAEFLEKNPVTTGLIADGAIRTLEQYQALLPLWEIYHLEPPRFVQLVIDDETAIERIEQRSQEAQDTAYHRTFSGKLVNRTDNNPLAIEERIALFHARTEPLLAYLQEQGRLISVDAYGEKAEVHQAILERL